MSDSYVDKLEDIMSKWDQKQEEKKQSEEASQIHAKQTTEKFPKIVAEIIKPVMMEACKKVTEKGHSCRVDESKDYIQIDIVPSGEHKSGDRDCHVTFTLWPDGEVSCNVFNGHHGDENNVSLEEITKEMVWDKILRIMGSAFQ